MRLGKAFFLTAAFVLGPEVVTSAQSAPERATFTVPAAPWLMVVPIDGLKVLRQQVKPDGRSGYFMLAGKSDGINVSFFIEPEVKCHSSRECRDMVWKDLKPTLKAPANVSTTEVGDVSVLEFLLPSFQGTPVNQQNMYAEFVTSGYWVDLHISKVSFTPEDRSLFIAFLKSISFAEKPNSTAPPGGA